MAISGSEGGTTFEITCDAGDAACIALMGGLPAGGSQGFAVPVGRAGSNVWLVDGKTFRKALALGGSALYDPVTLEVQTKVKRHGSDR
jgi:hypothetical protein